MTEEFNQTVPDAVVGFDPAASGQNADLSRLRDVPVELSVEIGRARMSVGETLGLRPGSIVTLDRLAEEPVDLLVNGTRIARGEVVVIDEDFGLRITEIPQRSAQQLARTEAPATLDELVVPVVDAEVVAEHDDVQAAPQDVVAAADAV
jgi:flagellar motor switch protein FliN/FliY